MTDSEPKKKSTKKKSTKSTTKRERRSRAKSDPHVERGKTYQTELPCALSPKDEKDFGQRLSKLEVQLEKLIAKKQESAKAANVEIKEIRAKISVLARDLLAGETKRRVRVHVERHFAANEWRLVREDTNDTVEKRALTVEERQRALPGVD